MHEGKTRHSGRQAGMEAPGRQVGRVEGAGGSGEGLARGRASRGEGGRGGGERLHDKNPKVQPRRKVSAGSHACLSGSP